MASGRRKHYKENRKKARRQQKTSAGGVLSVVFGAAAAALFAVSVVVSYAENGDGSFLLGTAGLIGLVFAFGGLALAVHAIRKEKEIRLLAPRTGLVFGIITSAAYALLYVFGFLYYFGVL